MLSRPWACPPLEREVDPSVARLAPHFVLDDPGIFGGVAAGAQQLLMQGVDDTLSADLAQYFSDFQLMHALNDHPRRMLGGDADGAALHIPIALPFPSLVMSRLGRLGNASGHSARMRNLSAHLEGSRAFRQRGRTLLIQSYWSLWDTLTQELLHAAFHQGATLIATADAFWSQIPPDPFEDSIVIPYRAHYLTARSSVSQRSQPRSGVLFHGALTNQHGGTRPGRAELTALRENLRLPFSLVTGQKAAFGCEHSKSRISIAHRRRNARRLRHSLAPASTQPRACEHFC